MSMMGASMYAVKHGSFLALTLGPGAITDGASAVATAEGKVDCTVDPTTTPTPVQASSGKGHKEGRPLL